MKRYVCLVCNEFVNRDYTFCTLCQNWLRLEPIKLIKMRAKIFGMDTLSDLGHAGPAICDLISVLRTVQIFYRLIGSLIVVVNNGPKFKWFNFW